MTSPPREITVICPACGNDYQDWIRPSINLTLDDFDEEYLDQATSATCPKCKHKVSIDVLIVREDGVWEMGVSEGEKRETPVCDKCGSGKVVPIVYGMPGSELAEAFERGEVELGGCVIGENDPEWLCRRCKHRW